MLDFPRAERGASSSCDSKALRQEIICAFQPANTTLQVVAYPVDHVGLSIVPAVGTARPDPDSSKSSEAYDNQPKSKSKAVTSSPEEATGLTDCPRSKSLAKD